MTSDDIIRMALEHFGAVLKPSDLEVKLAVLAVAQEREACAKVCEDKVDAEYATGKVDHNEMAWTQFCADAIRARGKK